MIIAATPQRGVAVLMAMLVVTIGTMIAVAARQRGVAILTAMLVVALGTVIAVNLMWSASLDLRRTTSALAADHGLMYLQGAEAWVGDILRQDQVDSIESDHLGEPWAIELPPLPVDGGAISGRVEDLQGRFNLNNLVTPQGQEDEIARRQFERLLVSLELDPALAGVALDWLDADGDTEFPFGAEDATYAGFDPPYRTPNFVITSPSELLAMSISSDNDASNTSDAVLTFRLVPEGRAVT